MSDMHTGTDAEGDNAMTDEDHPTQEEKTNTTQAGPEVPGGDSVARARRRKMSAPKKVATLALSAALASPVALAVTSSVDHTPKAHATRISPWGTKAAKFALKQRGKPYVFGATGPKSYDCSGLVYTAYKHAGLTIPRTTGGQLKHLGHRVSLHKLRTGDLVFQNKGHVAIYYGKNKIVSAPHTGAKVHSQKMYPMKYAIRIGKVSAKNHGYKGAAAKKKKKTPVRPWAKKATKFAVRHHGKHYRHGLVHGSFKWHSGLKRFPTIPGQHRVGHRVTRAQVKRGDIIVTKAHHAGIATNHNRFVYSLHKGGLVKTKKINNIATIRRVGNISAWNHGYHKKPAHR